jgi:uncharacterized protein YbjT (DUF2867 family)
MISTNNRVLILGGTGNYGRSITQSLINHDVNCSLLTRNIQKAKKLFGNQIKIVLGDIEDLASLEIAFQNINRIVCAISAFSIKQVRRYTEIEQDAVISAFQLANKMGIKRIVYISVFEVNKEFAKQNSLPFANEKAFIEDYLSKSNFNWTVLGAPPTMEIFFRMIHGTQMMVPGGGPKGLPTVSPVDVGEIAAQAVMRDDLSGQRIQMVAPQAYSFPDAASRISKVWGKTIKFLKIPIIFPTIAYNLSAPLSILSDRLLYVHTLLGFVRLLNNFPEKYIQQVPLLHQKLMSIFQYSPSTIEIEAERRRKEEDAAKATKRKR